MKAEAKNLFGDSNIYYLGQEKSNSLRGSTEVVNIHYLGQTQNLGQNSSIVDFPAPTNVLRRFIGMAQFCSRVIPHLNVELAPL